MILERIHSRMGLSRADTMPKQWLLNYGKDQRLENISDMP